jgi:hypothetical protein
MHCDHALVVWRFFLLYKCNNQPWVWNLAKWSERCASIPKFTGSNPSSGRKLTFHSDLLLTARGSSTWALIGFACLLCYLRVTHSALSAKSRRKSWVGAIQVPKFIFYLFNPFTASCENTMTLSVPGVPASCKKFPHPSQLNFWSTESIFNQFSVFLKTLNALCICLQYKHPTSMKRVIKSDKPVTVLLLFWSH